MKEHLLALAERRGKELHSGKMVLRLDPSSAEACVVSFLETLRTTAGNSLSFVEDAPDSSLYLLETSVRRLIPVESPAVTPSRAPRSAGAGGRAR
jgi:hypothetical protein